MGTGRSGSSVLAAICANAGAPFGMETREAWDNRSGANEHPGLIRAYKWWHRARTVQHAPVPDIGGRAWCERRARHELDRALSGAVFGKSSTLVWLVPLIADLGYEPRVIVLYRRFSEFAMSRHKRFGWSYHELRENYCDVYETALLQQQAFGGTVIAYEDLTDPAQTGWADALAKLTGLSDERLLAEREAITGEPRHHAAALWHDPAVERVQDALEAARNSVHER